MSSFFRKLSYFIFEFSHRKKKTIIRWIDITFRQKYNSAVSLLFITKIVKIFQILEYLSFFFLIFNFDVIVNFYFYASEIMGTS